MMLNLNNVTLIALDCVNPYYAVNALKYSSKDIKFNKMLLLSDTMPSNITKDIEWIKIPKINSIIESCIFSFYYMNGFIQTDFVMGIQSDGFIINPHLWEDEFFKYDFIGAPWPELEMENRIGNCGFAMRSKRFIELSQQIDWDWETPDDVFLNKINYDFFIKNGMKYPSPKVAAKFSMENPLWDIKYDLTKCFGFHKSWREESQAYVNMIRQDFPIWEK